MLESGTGANDSVTIVATGSVYIKEQTGDLRANVLQAGEDLWINVVSGDLEDANSNETVDERTYAELKSGVWTDLALVGSDAEAKLDDTFDAVKAIKEDEYDTYWKYRYTQADSSVYDSQHEVALSSEEEDYYEDYYTEVGIEDGLSGSDLDEFVEDSITTLVNSRTQQYHTLHEEFDEYDRGDYSAGDLTGEYVTDFSHTISTSEENELTDSVKIWTEDELLYTFSAGLLATVTDTTTNIEDSNLIGEDITIAVSGGVGTTSGTTLIDLTDTPVTLTEDQRVLLAAAERIDVIYVSELPVDVTVNFFDNGSSSDTLVRSSGSWINDGFSVDQYLAVLGDTSNQTDDGTYFQIASVTATTITLVSGNSLSTEYNRDVEVAPAILDPEFSNASITGMLVLERQDIDVTASGQIDVTASGNVYLGSESNIRIGQVIAGDSVVGDKIRIKGGVGIINSATGTTTNLRGNNLILEAADAAIGSSGAPIRTNVIGSDTVTARASTDIYLTETSGDMNVGTLYASTGNVVLEAEDGSILDGLNHEFTNILAQSIELTSVDSIGEAGNHLDIDVTSGSLTATAESDILIADTADNLNLRNVLSRNGDVELTAVLSILDDVDLVDPTDPDSGDDTSSPDSNPAADIMGNNITLTSSYGYLGVSGNDLDINSYFSGYGVLTATSEENVYLIETDGDLYLNQIGTGSEATAFVTVPGGSIFNGNPDDDGSNITSGMTYLIAAQDIGQSDNTGSSGAGALKTAVGNIEGRSTSGGTWIVNSGDMTVGGVVSDTSTGFESGGTTNISASSPVIISKSITAEVIIVTANEDANDVDDTTWDYITVESGVQLLSTAGSISLRAGDDLTLTEGSILNAATDIHLYGDYANADDAGSVMSIEGALIANAINIYGNDDDDTVIYSPESVSGYTTIVGDYLSDLGSGGDDDIILDELPSITSERDRGDGVVQRDTIDLDGQGGSDRYIVNLTGTSDYLVNVLDTGADDNGGDRLTLNGTIGDDVFLVRKNFVALLQENESPDEDDGRFLDTLERINYSSTVNARLRVNGHDGDDEFYSDDNNTMMTLDGADGDDRFQIGQVFGSERSEAADTVAAGDEIDTTSTTLGFLSKGISFPTTVLGGDGEDQFAVYSNKALLKLFGEDGNDTFVIRAFVINGESSTGETELNTGAGDDKVEYNINAPVNIDGGSGADTVVVLGTEESDTFVVSKEGVMGAGLNVSYVGIEILEVDALEGDDHFFVLSTNADIVTTLIGGKGSDTMDIGGDVTEEIVALSVEGSSGVINHAVTSDLEGSDFEGGIC